MPLKYKDCPDMGLLIVTSVKSFNDATVEDPLILSICVCKLLEIFWTSVLKISGIGLFSKSVILFSKFAVIFSSSVLKLLSPNWPVTEINHVWIGDSIIEIPYPGIITVDSSEILLIWFCKFPEILYTSVFPI